MKGFTQQELDNKDICFYCGQKLDNSNRSRDHIDPIRKGSNRHGPKCFRGNRVWACLACNKAKDNLTLEEFIQTPYFKFWGRNNKLKEEGL